MKVLLYLSALVLVVVMATWTYRVNYAAQAALDRVAGLQARLAAEREAIAVLEAEWAFLNRPDRLRALVVRYRDSLDLVPFAPEHFGEAAMIAFPPEDPMPTETGGETR